MGIRERTEVAASMPHRQNAPNPLDDRLESAFGRLYLHGHISEAEFDAGVRYAQIVLDYLQSIDAPKPYGRGFRELSEDECFKRKVACSQSRQILKDAARASRRRETTIISAVDNLVVYGEVPATAEQAECLIIGLRALAHGSNVITFPKSIALTAR